METLVILQAIALIILATASLVLFKDFKDANQKLQTLSSRIRAAASLRLGGVEYFLPSKRQENSESKRTYNHRKIGLHF